MSDVADGKTARMARAEPDSCWRRRGWAPFVPRRRPGRENGSSHIARTKEGQMAASSSPQSGGIAASQRDAPHEQTHDARKELSLAILMTSGSLAGRHLEGIANHRRKKNTGHIH